MKPPTCTRHLRAKHGHARIVPTNAALWQSSQGPPAPPPLGGERSPPLLLALGPRPRPGPRPRLGPRPRVLGLASPPELGGATRNTASVAQGGPVARG